MTASFPILTLLLALPLAGALACVLAAGRPALCRAAALAATGATFAVALTLFCSGGRGWIAFEDHAWIGRFGIRYTLGLDSLSLLMVVLTAFLLLLSVLVSWPRNNFV